MKIKITISIFFIFLLGGCGSSEPTGVTGNSISNKEYVLVSDVKRDLDCRDGVSDEVKEQFMKTQYKNKSIVFDGKILSIDGSKIKLFGMLGTGLFSGTPTLYLKNADIVREKVLLEESTYKFDCDITDICRNGFFSNSLSFSNCDIVN